MTFYRRLRASYIFTFGGTEGRYVFQKKKNEKKRESHKVCTLVKFCFYICKPLSCTKLSKRNKARFQRVEACLMLIWKPDCH